MSKFIGVKMIEAVPMTAEEAIKNHYIVSAFSSEKDGYEVTYNNGYKSWCPKSIFERTYFDIKFDDKLSPEDIDNFIKSESCTTVGKKTTIGVLTCLTGFEATESSSCVKPENYDINIGKKYAIEKAKDQIWSGLGFVLQWAINGLKKK